MCYFSRIIKFDNVFEYVSVVKGIRRENEYQILE